MSDAVQPNLAAPLGRSEAASPDLRPAWSLRRFGRAGPREVLGIVCVGIVLANLDLFIVNVGLPAIAHDFSGATLEDLSWVLNGYAIAYAALLVFFGRLAERFRRDRSFLLGVALFTLASAACACAGGVWSLVAFRVLQAAGGALMTPTSIGLLLATFPPEGRGGAVRAWAAIGGLAAALGPVVGGVLIELSWRWIFLVNVPIGLVALLVAWLRLPSAPGHDVPRPDPLPALLATACVGALTLAIVKGHDWGWASAATGFTLAVALACGAAFVRDCLRSANPFVDPSLFRCRPFAGAVLVMAPYSIAFGAMLFSMAVWEQTVWGWSALKAGLAIAPGPLLVPVTSFLLASRLIARFGPAAVVGAGIVSFVAGLACWATLTGLSPSLGSALVGTALTGFGVGLAFPTLMGIGTAALPPSSFSTGSGVINMVRQSSLAVGVAIFVAVVGAASLPAERVAAFHRGWWLMAAITALGLIPTVWLIRRPPPSR